MKPSPKQKVRKVKAWIIVGSADNWPVTLRRRDAELWIGDDKRLSIIPCTISYLQ